MKPEHKLRMIRKAYGFTQTQMAEKLNTCQTAYGKLERDQTAMTVERAHQLAEALKVDPRVFTTHEDIVLLTTEDHKVEVLFKSELNKVTPVEEPSTHLLLDIKARIERIEKILRPLKKPRKRTSQLKALW